MRKMILIAILLVLSISCSGTKNNTDVWVGKTQQNLIKSWGPPVRTLDDGKEGKIFIYAEQIYANHNNSEGSKMAGPHYWSYEYMYINKEGRIYLCKNEKQKSPPQEIVLKN
ncbi:hypothetical protein [uncultured Flavobacterium sp.]|uniref:hypothetical protein n=1 Tax=uncultured Flavobacterium sp. TaxID=165435 RepID=UPI00292F33E3|nr:hypothetical protein [uncultured Flavobacterium sp.]